jgi:hypothetical protein
MPSDSEKSTNMANMDIDEIEHVGERSHQGLGTLRLRHQETQEILLIPTPSDDPNDPLNWWALLMCEPAQRMTLTRI